MTTPRADSLRVPIPRVARVPDPVRIARYRHAPDLGPRILFFSGGSALRTVSRRLITYTHNSIHLITPFDSGGSSAVLRTAFGMPAVGDLRNRLMALADQSIRGNPEIYTLFSFRFPENESSDTLTNRLGRMVRGSDPLMRDVPEPLRGIVRHHLGFFRDAMPDGFDLSGAAVGNLVLAGGYLNQSRSLDSVLYLFSRLVEARGIVRPVVDRSMHLVAELEDGTRLVGQHRISGRNALSAPISKLFLTRSKARPEPERPVVHPVVADLIEEADLICYPIGSYHTSLLATLLPSGISEAIARSDAPKIYIPNPHETDPEELGLDLPGKVRRLLETLERGTSEKVEPKRLLGYVLVDDQSPAPAAAELRAVEVLGMTVIRAPLSTPEHAPLYDDDRLIEVLLSLV